MISELYEPYQNLSSPEVSSDLVIQKNGSENVEKLYSTGESDSSTKVVVSEALRRLEEQLSLNEDSFKEFVDDDPNGSDIQEYPSDSSNQEQFTAFHGREPIVHDQFYSGYAQMQGNANISTDILDYHSDIINQDQFTPFHGREHILNDQFYSGRAQMQSNADISGEHRQFLDHEFADGNKESVSWKEVLNSSGVEHQEKRLYTLDRSVSICGLNFILIYVHIFVLFQSFITQIIYG